MEFRDLKRQYQLLETDINKAIASVLANADFISGNQVEILEKRLSDYVGVKHCISCANGTDALSMVLRAWGVGQGDAVFVPDFTFFATAEVVSFVGATPIFVDVDERTFNIDPYKLELKIVETIKNGNLNPKVIIPVDLFGLLADYSAIEIIAKKYKLLILEDGAQGFGAEQNGKRACSFGQAATTSFFPAKPLGCYGDGGAIFTNDDALAATLESLRVHGKGADKYDNIQIGVNSRLDTIQAAILNVKFDEFIKNELTAVNNVYVKYNIHLSNVIEVPYIPEGNTSSFAQYTVKLKNKDQRDGLKQYLLNNGIPSMVYYTKPLHKQTAFSNLNISDKDYSVANKLCNTALSLPMHPYLTDEDIDFVTSHIKKFLSIDV